MHEYEKADHSMYKAKHKLLKSFFYGVVENNYTGQMKKTCIFHRKCLFLLRNIINQLFNQNLDR